MSGGGAPKDLLEYGDVSAHVEVVAATVRTYDGDEDDDESHFLEARLRNRTDSVLEELKCDISYYRGEEFLGLDRSDYEELDKIGPRESLGFDLSLSIPDGTERIVMNVHALVDPDGLRGLGDIVKHLG